MAACSSRVADRTQTRSRHPRSFLVNCSGRSAPSLRKTPRRAGHRPNLRVELGRLDACMAEQAADLLEIAVLLVDLYRHSVAKVVRLQHRVADQATVRLAEPPDVLAFHRPPDRALAPQVDQNTGVSGLMSSTSVGR